MSYNIFVVTDLNYKKVNKMATNALLAVKHRDGSIKTVSVYWDGDTLLPKLQQFYSTPFFAEELISYGNISSLGERVHPVMSHSFEKPEPDTTVFYHRDRGEDLCIYEYTEKEWHQLRPQCEYEYTYFFDGDWSAI
jgi:hypothetical protein